MSPPNASDGRPLGTGVESTDLLTRNTPGGVNPAGEGRWCESSSEDAAHAAVGERPEDHHEQHADRPDDHADQGQQGVVEEHAEAQQDNAERGERVEAGERRGDEGGEGENEDEGAEEDAAEAMHQQEAQAWPRVALQPANPREQPLGGALLLRRPEAAGLPPLRQPDGLAPRDQLQSDEHRNQLEDVGHAARRQGQRGQGEEEHEQHREALLLKELDEAADRLRPRAPEPLLQAIAEALHLHGRLRLRHPPILPAPEDERPGPPGRSRRWILRVRRQAVGASFAASSLAFPFTSEAFSFSAFASGVSSSAWRPMRSSLAITRRWICEVPS